MLLRCICIIWRWRNDDNRRRECIFPWGLCVTLINCLRGILIKLCRDFSINHSIYALRVRFSCAVRHDGTAVSAANILHWCQTADGAETLVRGKHTYASTSELWNCGRQATNSNNTQYIEYMYISLSVLWARTKIKIHWKPRVFFYLAAEWMAATTGVVAVVNIIHLEFYVGSDYYAL